MGNPGAPRASSVAYRDVGKVALADVDIMPIDAANDVLAHEMGHVMDWWYAGDRLVPQDDVEGRGVEEAIADMFAYEYDRFDATNGEDSRNGVLRNWANPHSPNAGGVTFPAHMNEYDPSRSPHYNSTILSHAYYRFVQSVGHHKAGRVLHTVPGLLPPLPRFANACAELRDPGRLLVPRGRA